MRRRVLGIARAVMHALLLEATKSTKIILWVTDDLAIAIAMLCFSIWVMRRLFG